MKKIDTILNNLSRKSFLLLLVVVLMSHYYAITITQSTRIIANETLVPGSILDTTVSARKNYEIRAKTGHLYFKDPVTGFWVRLDGGTGGGGSGTAKFRNGVATGDSVLIPLGPDTFQFKRTDITVNDPTSLTVQDNTNADHMSFDFLVKNLGNSDLTLQGNRNVAGNAKSLSLGTGGSNITNLVVNASGATDLFSSLVYGVDVFSGNAIHTIPTNVGKAELDDGSLSANRVITLPTATINGTELAIINKGNNASFFYTFGSTVTDNSTGSTVTNIAHRTTYILHYDASLAWRIIYKYP